MNVFLTKSILSVAALSAFALATVPLAAQAGQVSNRVDRQEMRINQGIRSGQLTGREYRRVDGRLDAVNAQRRADLRANDGHLTPSERAQLNRQLNRGSDKIYFDKHNRTDQPGV